MKNLYDVIIVGSGPAGLTAAIYTSRARLKTLVVAGFQWGGQLMLTSEVENFPGHKDGILGPELINEILKQAERFGAEFLYEDATDLHISSRPFRIILGSKEYKSKSIILATGASPRWLGLESENRLQGKGVSSCATCDAAFFADKETVVIGGGDAAIEDALVLSKFAKSVKIIHRRDKLRASRILQERAFKDPKIEFIWNSTVKEILGKNRVEGIRLETNNKEKDLELKCDGVFIAIGHIPNTEILKGKLDMDNEGYIQVNEKNETSIQGVFAAGDAVDSTYRQAITAAGSGCKAAINIQRYLSNI
jgi:thioredoxin reductase (NADPH)